MSSNIKELTEQYLKERHRSAPDQGKIEKILDEAVVIAKAVEDKPVEESSQRDVIKTLLMLDQLSEEDSKRVDELKDLYFAEKEKENPDQDKLLRLKLEGAMLLDEQFDRMDARDSEGHYSVDTDSENHQDQMYELRDQYLEELNKAEPDEGKLAEIVDEVQRLSKIMDAEGKDREIPKMTEEDRAKMHQVIDSFSEKYKARFEMLEARYFAERETADPDTLQKITLETAMLFGDRI